MDKAELRPARWLGLLWVTLLVVFYAYPLWIELVPSFTPSLTVILSASMLTVFIRSLFQVEDPFYMWLSTIGGIAYCGVLGGSVCCVTPLGGWPMVADNWDCDNLGK